MKLKERKLMRNATAVMPDRKKGVSAVRTAAALM
jgi:hypothetical protein